MMIKCANTLLAMQEINVPSAENNDMIIFTYEKINLRNRNGDEGNILH